MKISLKNIFVYEITVFLSLIMFGGCTEEFDLFNDELKLTGNYEEVVAVYANICPQNDTNYLRINRGFAVDNFYTVHTNPDSIYFSPEDVQVFAHKISGEDTLKTYLCRDTLIEKDSAGAFPTDKILLYYFISDNLTTTYDQDIDFGFTLITRNKFVRSQTYLVRAPQAANPYLNYLNFSHGIFRYGFFSFKGTQIVEVDAVCSFFEKRLLDNKYDTVKITFDFSVGGNTYQDAIATDYYSNEYIVGIGQIVGRLKYAIERYGDIENTNKRWMGDIYFKVRTANADYALFESFNNSIATGFNQEPISYSNIENGVGFLTSYSKSNTRRLLFTKATRDSIAIRMYGYHFE
jgi:hypothetical protein